MSAYVVSNDTIDLLVAAADRWMQHLVYMQSDEVRALAPQFSSKTDHNLVGQQLLAENVHSVNVRYRGNDPVPAYRYQPVNLDRVGRDAGMDSAVVVLKSIQCVRYQSCEAEDYRQSAGAALLDALEAAVMRGLSGYEDAAWGWERTPEPPAPAARSLAGVH